MDYEALEMVNAELKTMDIKGKKYAMVNQRVLGFWQLFPNGSIKTELLVDDGNRCLFKAIVSDGEQIIATGHAFETKEGTINKTSYIENCETSAVGRALAMLGIGSADSIASAEEVRNAMNQQWESSEVVGECTACGQRYLFANEEQLGLSMCQCGSTAFRRV